MMFSSSRMFPGQRYPPKCGSSAAGSFRSGLAVLARRLHEQHLHQLGDVVRAIAQRRQFERNHGQPVIEILAKRAVLDHRLQIAMRGGDHPHIHAFRLERSDLSTWPS